MTASKAAFARRGDGALDKVGVALGTMNFGKRTPEGDAKRIVDRAYERGVRVIDTANVYESGASEAIVGRAIAETRDEWLVATKVGLDRKGKRAEGLSPGVVRSACDESLRRLGVATIDLYYLHAPDPETPIEATLEVVSELERAGKIRAFGASNFASWQILEMIRINEGGRGASRPLVAQQIYNLLVRQLDVEYFRFAKRYEVHTTTYNALAGGLLARSDLGPDRVPPGSRFDKNTMYQRRYLSRAFFDALDRYRALASEAGLSLAGFAYAWLAAQPSVDSVLVGPASVEQLDFALDALSAPLDAELCRRVDGIARELAGTDARYAR